MQVAERLIEAIKTGDVGGVNSLLDSDRSLVETKSEHGVSAVLLATYFGHDDVADALLERGADVGIFEAAALGRLDRVAELIKGNRELLTAYSADGFTALGLAAFFGRRDVLEYLLEAGADPNAASKNQMHVAPIHSAVAHRKPGAALAMAEALLSKGAEVNVAQAGGWTPLHQAAAHGHADMVALLLSCGADAGAESDRGETPLGMAENNHHAYAAAILRENGDGVGAE